MTADRLLTLYSKAGCHLCDEMRALVEELADHGGVRVQEVDITGNAALFERYRHDVPVLLLDGQEIARHRTTRESVAAALLGH